jgi:hypothetical protein
MDKIVYIRVAHGLYRDGEYLHINARFLRIGIAQFFYSLGWIVERVCNMEHGLGTAGF